MRVLWIATKAPWPPRDGGRLLLAETLAALRSSASPAPLDSPAALDSRASLASLASDTAPGIDVTLVAPVKASDLEATEAALRPLCRPSLVAIQPRSRGFAALTATVSGRPYSLARHDRPELARRVARELHDSQALHGAPFDLVVAEQLQAFAQSAPAGPAGPLHVPRILRAQNVESDLWRQLGQASRGVARTLLLREAARLAGAERAALAAAAATIALSAADGERLRALAPESARIEVLPPPFPGQLAASGQRLVGAPALVLFGSAGWEPNRRAEQRFVDEIWPRVRAASPAAALHWFGGSGPERPGVFVHRSPSASAEAFSPDAMLVLPLDIASGVRMRVLEAWARGVVIVASPAAASGLTASDGRELLIARDAEEFAVAIERLTTIDGLADRLIAGGRERLAADHSPARFAARFSALAERVIGHFGGARGG